MVQAIAKQIGIIDEDMYAAGRAIVVKGASCAGAGPCWHAKQLVMLSNTRCKTVCVERWSGVSLPVCLQATTSATGWTLRTRWHAR